MSDRFYPSIGVPNNRPIRVRQEMQLHVPRVGGGLGRIVPRNVDEYPAWMFTGRVPRDDRQLGSEYANGAVQPLNLVIRDPRRWQNNDTRASRDIAQGTLNETHQNLESAVGQYFKSAWDMPYEANSRVDDAANATWAAHFFAGSLEERQLLVGANVGERRAAHLAAVELHAHGLTGAPAGHPWYIAGAADEPVPVQSVVAEIAQQGEANSLLITACNMEHRFVQGVADLQVIHGLGKGYYHGKSAAAVAEAGFGAFHSWRDAVVMHQGDDAVIFPKSAVHAALLRQGVYTGPAADGLVGIGLDQAAGVPRIGTLPGEVTRESMLKSTMPLADAPHIRAHGFDSHGQGGTFTLPGGEQFGSLPEAEAALTHSIRAGIDPARLEAVAAAEARTGQSMSRALQTTPDGFSAHGFTGILIGGALTLGGLWLATATHPGPALGPRGPHGGPPPDRGGTEGETEHVTHKPGARPAYRATTALELSDAPLNEERLDHAFAHHLQYGTTPS